MIVVASSVCVVVYWTMRARVVVVAVVMYSNNIVGRRWTCTPPSSLFNMAVKCGRVLLPFHYYIMNFGIWAWSFKLHRRSWSAVTSSHKLLCKKYSRCNRQWQGFAFVRNWEGKGNYCLPLSRLDNNVKGFIIIVINISLKGGRDVFEMKFDPKFIDLTDLFVKKKINFEKRAWPSSAQQWVVVAAKSKERWKAKEKKLTQIIFMGRDT